MIYYFLLLFVAISYFSLKYFIKDSRKAKILFFIFSGLLLITVSSLRANEIGNDLKTYLNIFYASNDIPVFDLILDALNPSHFGSTSIYNGFYEVGYVLLNKTIIFFSNSNFVFKFVTSSIIVSSYLLIIFKFSKLPLFSVVLMITLGYYMQSMVIIRQCLALSILLFGYEFIEEKKINKFILTVLIATLFHKSAIVFLITYPLCNCVYSKKKVIYLSLIILIVFIFSKPFISILVQTIYPFYLDYIVSGEGFNYFLLLFALSIFGSYLVYKDYKDIKNIMIIFMIGTVIQLFTIHFSLLNRLAFYFQFFILLFIPNAISKNSYKKIYLVIVLLLSMVYFQKITIERDAGGTADYKILCKTVNESIKDG